MGCMTKTPIRALCFDVDSFRCSPEPLKQRSGQQLMTPLGCWTQTSIRVLYDDVDFSHCLPRPPVISLIGPPSPENSLRGNNL